MIDASAQLLRDGVLATAWLTAVYLVYSTLRLAELRRREQCRRVAAGIADLRLAAPPPGLPIAAQAVAKPQAGAESPRYSARHRIALSLAFQGFGAADIAQRCDIPVAEARRIVVLTQAVVAPSRPLEEEHGPKRAAA